VESRIPGIYFNSEHRLRNLPRPRILKSPESFQRQYSRVSYILRDPRDVAVSFYHHNGRVGNIPYEYPSEAFILHFNVALFDRKWGSCADAGSWKGTLSAESVACIEAAWEGLMQKLDYELATAATPSGSLWMSQAGQGGAPRKALTFPFTACGAPGTSA
jgi:hypothetical protein